MAALTYNPAAILLIMTPATYAMNTNTPPQTPNEEEAGAYMAVNNTLPHAPPPNPNTMNELGAGALALSPIALA